MPNKPGQGNGDQHHDLEAGALKTSNIFFFSLGLSQKRDKIAKFQSLAALQLGVDGLTGAEVNELVERAENNRHSSEGESSQPGQGDDEAHHDFEVRALQTSYTFLFLCCRRNPTNSACCSTPQVWHKWTHHHRTESACPKAKKKKKKSCSRFQVAFCFAPYRAL